MPLIGARVWRARTARFELGAGPLIMGIVNVAPDSFSDGGNLLSVDAAVAHGCRLVADGAHLVDVGGESTRPGAEAVDAAEELRRVLPVVERLSAERVPVSIDTSKVEVAERALAAGAEAVNDVTALADPDMVGVVREAGAGLVLMHMLGTPRTMQLDPHYDDVVEEVGRFLVERARAAEQAGVDRAAIMIDPGIGFGKTVEHNLELLRRLDVLVATGYPVLVGTSRKSFLGKLTGVEDPAMRDLATAVTVALAVERGAAAVRVHDVAGSRQAAMVATAIVQGEIG